MRHKISSFAMALLVITLAGCNGYVLGGSYWDNALTSTQEAGVGSDVLNVKDDLGMELTDATTEFNILLGGHSSQRLHISYWSIHADGERTGDLFTSPITFAGVTFLGIENLTSSIDIESASVLWEPSLIKTRFFRLRPVLGVNLMSLQMAIEEVSGAQHVLVTSPGEEGPLSSVGLDMIPIPVVGVCLEVALAPKWFLHAQGQLFDTAVAEEELADMIPDFTATFRDGTAGLVYMPTSNISLIVGYRHFEVNYVYDADKSDSIISGPFAGLSMTLGGADE